MNRLARPLAIALLVGLYAVPAPALACPNCKEAVANQLPEAAARLSRGYSYSIMLMLLMPVSLITGGTFAVIRAVKRGALPEL